MSIAFGPLAAQASVVLAAISGACLILGTGPAAAQIRDANGLEQVRTAPLAKTGQTTSYALGDDGDIEVGVAGHSPRFTDNGDGTVSDRLTSLAWTKDAAQYAILWTDALSYCNSYPAGTPTGWRLPNIRELMSLLDFEQKLPMLSQGHPFTNVVSAVGTYYYWSSTTNPVFDSLNDVHAVNLGTGEVRIWPKNSGGYILCTRSR